MFAMVSNKLVNKQLSISTVSFLVDLGHKISEHTGEPLEVQFLFQWISVLFQRFNSVLFHKTFPVEDNAKHLAIPACFYT